ncbi:hypothetical protein ACFQPI_15765, partial [Insolitispirillum peregrinum]|uniref:hypothetical protein n=1 Tax=Insolitispirillum peregrinum TaxID=80876 RepID=UPI0036146D34
LIEQPPTHPFRLFTMSNSEPFLADPEGPEFLDCLPLSKLPVSGRWFLPLHQQPVNRFFHRFVTFQFAAAASNLIVPKPLTVSARPLSQSANPLNFPAFSASLPSPSSSGGALYCRSTPPSTPFFKKVQTAPKTRCEKRYQRRA